MCHYPSYSGTDLDQLSGKLQPQCGCSCFELPEQQEQQQYYFYLQKTREMVYVATASIRMISK